MAEVKALIKGYLKFYQKYFASGNELYQKLTKKGQSPKTLIICCSDSRVDPSTLTTAEPGDIFVIRNIANLVPPYEDSKSGLHGVSAALEFAVRILKVKHIVIIGHSGCSGIRALIDSDIIEGTDFISSWMSVAKAAKEKVVADFPDADEQTLLHKCEKESILFSLQNLLTFPWVKSRVVAGDLKLHGWHFSLEDGCLREYNPNEEKFEVIPIDIAI